MTQVKDGQLICQSSREEMGSIDKECDRLKQVVEALDVEADENQKYILELRESLREAQAELKTAHLYQGNCY